MRKFKGVGLRDGAVLQVDSAAWREARQLAAEGKIAPLRLCILNVTMAPSDGKRRYCSASIAAQPYQSSRTP